MRLACRFLSFLRSEFVSVDCVQIPELLTQRKFVSAMFQIPELLTQRKFVSAMCHTDER